MCQSPAQSAIAIKQHAQSLGFDLVGIAGASRSQRADYFRKWLDEGQHGSMEWMARRFDERVDPAVYLPGARSVICLAMNYHVPLEAEREIPESGGRIARYALGEDYHDVLKKRLHALADWMRQRWPDIQTRACVDTAPLMEKDLAARAGLGWIGKNSCLINEQIGSWFFLGEVVTTMELPPDEPAMDHCGTCRRCIDACPTQAITAPYQLDARRCISYLTIEHRQEISLPLQRGIGDWLYGCDICQDVCPHNHRAPESTEPAFRPRFSGGKIDADKVLAWQPADYQNRLRGSAMKRIKLPLLQRNAGIVRGNANSCTEAPPPVEMGDRAHENVLE